MYRDLLAQLPSQPEIHLANSGARALALLEAESFTLLISDLKMPKMDGLQVLSIVRSRFPDLRVVVMTSMLDEQYRTRAYAMGVDLFWVKPTNPEEIKMFQDCIAALLVRDTQSGFRGVQSKSLVDLIQLECLSSNSSVLKVVNGPKEGRVWIHDGEIIDAAVGELNGTNAFKDISSWRTGAFEILPPEPERQRTIFENYQGLLLDTAQTLDETQGAEKKDGEQSDEQMPLLAALGRIEGVEFVLEISLGENANVESWGINKAEPLVQWTRDVLLGFSQLGEKLRVGQPTAVRGIGWQGHLAILSENQKALCAGLRKALAAEDVAESMNKIKSQWR